MISHQSGVSAAQMFTKYFSHFRTIWMLKYFFFDENCCFYENTQLETQKATLEELSEFPDEEKMGWTMTGSPQKSHWCCGFFQHIGKKQTLGAFYYGSRCFFLANLFFATWSNKPWTSTRRACRVCWRLWKSWSPPAAWRPASKPSWGTMRRGSWRTCWRKGRWGESPWPKLWCFFPWPFGCFCYYFGCVDGCRWAYFVWDKNIAAFFFLVEAQKQMGREPLLFLGRVRTHFERKHGPFWSILECKNRGERLLWHIVLRHHWSIWSFQSHVRHVLGWQGAAIIQQRLKHP